MQPLHGSRSSIGLRAALAIVLMIGFYILALSIAGGLLWIPYAEYVYRSGVHARIAFFCIVTAGMIVWSILPRIDKFPAPGPLLRKLDQPRLFGIIEEVSGLTGQAMPSEVYLVPDLNAWVAQRGGLMGMGSRRVMGIGLPLIHSLSVDEFRAVLAHEFGHYHGGDTRLGPWIYKTRTALARTIQSLHSDSIGLMLVQSPFRAYGAFFMRVTQAVSRAQEYAADALSARLVGARHLASGLKTIHAQAPIYDGFWQAEYTPLLSLGAMPSIGEGFRRFLESKRVREALPGILKASLEETRGNPFDTHPVLKLRLQAIGEPAEPLLDRAGPLMWTILEKIDDLERSLLSFQFGDKAVAGLQRVAWEDVWKVYRSFIEMRAAEAAGALKGVTPLDLPEIARQFHVREDRLCRARGGETYFRDQGNKAVGFLGPALILAALRAGSSLTSRPGRPALVRIGDEDIDFFEEFARLRSEEADRERWNRIISKAGIAGVDLGAMVQ